MLSAAHPFAFEPFEPRTLLSAGSAITYLAAQQDLYHRTTAIYTDADAACNHFVVPSFDQAGAYADMRAIVQRHSGATAIEGMHDAQKSPWSGVYFYNGAQKSNGEVYVNYGATPKAGLNLFGATQTSFYAKGAVGGETVKFVAFGSGRGEFAYPDSAPEASITCTLTTGWKRYTMDVSDLDLRYVLRGFGWVVSNSQNAGRDVTFFVDDIVYNKPRLAVPHLLRSYATQANESGFDRTLRNTAFTYDNALALIAFVNSANKARAQSLADALVYAQKHDRYYSDSRLRDAYQASDLALPPGWTPNGRSGAARIAGWTDEDGVWKELGAGTSAGNMAWATLALVTYYRKFGGAKYLTAALSAANWIMTNCYDTRGAGGFTAGIGGGEGSASKLLYKSAEHNVDIFAAFRALYRATGDAIWLDRAVHARAFVQSMWDAGDGKFWTGTTPDGVTINYNVIALDVQAWANMTLGAKYAQYRPALDYAYSHLRVGQGYDFNQDLDGVWTEGTAQMADAWKSAGNATRATATLSYLDSVQLASGGFYAASKNNLTTGFDYAYARRVHIAPTAWFYLASKGINPLG